MGYEDGYVDRQKRNYGNVRRPKVKISRNYNKIHSHSRDSPNKTMSNQEPSKKKKTIRCGKKFNFSKYPAMSKKVLYDYQIEECRQGLRDDAQRQMDYILNLIGNCEKKSYVKCKIDEIKDFMTHHNLRDDNIKNKIRAINDSYNEKFN